MNEYNNLYGFNLRDKEEDMFKNYIKPKYSDGFKKLNKQQSIKISLHFNKEYYILTIGWQ